MSDYIPDWDSPSPVAKKNTGSFVPEWDTEPAVTKATALPSGVQPSTAGGGRGGQGGPSFEQARLYQGGRNQAVSAGTGLVKGATLGLSKYITAGEAYLADNARALMKGNPGMTWQQALQYTKQEMDAQAEANPGAFYGGQAAGTVLNAAATGGATVPQLMVRGAIQGGVSGYTDNENLGDAATGAILGAGTGGAVGGVAKGVGSAKNYVVNKTAPYAEQYLKGGLTRVFAPFENKVAELAAKYGINPTAENAYQQIGRMATASEKAELNSLATQATNAPVAGSMVRQNIKDAATGALEGGVTGGLISGLSGGDITQGALYGAGFGGGAKPLARQLGTIAAPYAARAIHRSSLGLPDSAPGSFSQYLTPETAARLGTASLTTPDTLKDANSMLMDLFK